MTATMLPPHPGTDPEASPGHDLPSGARRYLPLAIAAGLAIIATFLLAVAL